MTKVKLEVILQIDSDDEDEIDIIINNMEYYFSYIKIEKGIGKTLNEKEYILDQEIPDYYKIN